MQRDRFHFCMLKRLHNMRGGVRLSFCCSICGSVPRYAKHDSLLPRTQACGIRAFFRANTRFPSVSSTRREVPSALRQEERNGEGKREKEGRGKSYGAIAKGIYAILGVTLRLRHRKMAKLFETPLAASVLVAG